MNLTKLTNLFSYAEDVTASRSNNTIYENTHGKPMIVMVSYSAITVSVDAQMSSSSPPSNVFAFAGVYFPCSIIVPPGYYYRMVEVGGAATIYHWVEAY